MACPCIENCFSFSPLGFLASSDTFRWWEVFLRLKYKCWVQPLSHVWLFVTPCTAARQTSLSITNSQSLLKLMSIELMMPSNHSSSVAPFSCFQSFPASGAFVMNQFFSSGGQIIGASSSVLPMNIQDWFLFRMDWFDLAVRRTLKSLL